MPDPILSAGLNAGDASQVRDPLEMGGLSGAGGASGSAGSTSSAAAVGGDVNQDAAADAALQQALGQGQQTGGAAGDPTNVTAISPVVAWMQDKLGVQNVENEDQLADLLNATLDREELARKTFGENFNEDRARQLVEIETRYNQLAPDLEAFNRWKQQQFGVVSQGQQLPLQYGQQGQYGGAPVQQQQQLPAQFAPVEQPASHLYQLVQRDAATGIYRPLVAASPDCVAAADAITKYERSLTERGRQFLANPFAVVDQHPVLSQIQRQLAEFKQFQDEQRAAMQAQQQSDLFFQKHGQSLSEQDPKTGQAKWNRTGEVFLKILENNLAAGMPAKDAHEKALSLAQDIAPLAAKSGAPQNSGNGQPKTKSAGFVRNGLSRSQRQARPSDHSPGTQPARTPGDIEVDSLTPEAMFEASMNRVLAEHGGVGE